MTVWRLLAWLYLALVLAAVVWTCPLMPWWRQPWSESRRWPWWWR